MRIMMMMMSHIFLCCHHILRRSATPVLLVSMQNDHQILPEFLCMQHVPWRHALVNGDWPSLGMHTDAPMEAVCLRPEVVRLVHQVLNALPARQHLRARHRPSGSSAAPCISNARA